MYNKDFHVKCIKKCKQFECGECGKEANSNGDLKKHFFVNDIFLPVEQDPQWILGDFRLKWVPEKMYTQMNKRW